MGMRYPPKLTTPADPAINSQVNKIYLQGQANQLGIQPDQPPAPPQPQDQGPAMPGGPFEPWHPDPMIEGQLAQIEQSRKADIGNQQAAVQALNADRTALLEQPQQVNLSPIAGLLDSWTPGSKLSESYRPPQTPQERQAYASKLQDQINQAQMGMNKDQQQYLTEQLRARLSQAADKSKDELEKRKFMIEQQHRQDEKALKENEMANNKSWHDQEAANQAERNRILASKLGHMGQKTDELVPVQGATDPEGLPVYRYRLGSQKGYFDVNGNSIAGQQKLPAQVSAVQSKNAAFADQASQAHDILSGLESDPNSFDPTSLTTRLQMNEHYPEALKSGNVKSYEQAQNEFLNAATKFESTRQGTPYSLEQARKRFIPGANDSPANVAQKVAARQKVVEDMQKAAVGSKPGKPQAMNTVPPADTGMSQAEQADYADLLSRE